jgi:uncharacterized membrane protein YphA (DoxX/SURF4 family)
MSITRQKFGMHLLRLGLAGVFLWFGFSQLIDSLRWVSIVPEWAVNLLHLPPAMIVMANGLFEVVLAGILAMGFFVRTTSLILGLHLTLIAFDFGFTATGVRDIGLVVSAFALSLMYTKDEVKADLVG